MNQVKEFMQENPVMVDPDSTLVEAARLMKEHGCGFLPVGSEGQPIGIITDRDIVVRALAGGLNPEMEKVRSCMTEDICACKVEDTLDSAAGLMSENRISRLLVQDMNGQVCGVLTFGRIIRANNDREETGRFVFQATGKAA